MDPVAEAASAFAPKGSVGTVKTSTSPMLLVPAGRAEEITVAPVLTAVTFPFRLERVDSVPAREGSGREAADTGWLTAEPSTLAAEAAVISRFCPPESQIFTLSPVDGWAKASVGKSSRGS